MPTDGVSTEKLDELESWIAEILTGRARLIDLEVTIRGWWRRGQLDTEDANQLLDLTQQVRAGLARGQQFGKMVRGKPEGFV